MKDLQEWRRGNLLISTKREHLQIEAILSYMQNDSYWAQDRTRKQMETVIDNSLCFGVYHSRNQIGFARVVTDFATFAYLGDVYIEAEYQDQGIGAWLMECVIEHRKLQGFRRWVLATRDAHKLYQKFGFTELKHPERWMELAAPDAY